MKCTSCGATMVAGRTDLPFKVGRHAIVVVRDTPVLECPACPEFLIDDSDMERIEQVLVSRSPSTELEVVSFAA